MAVDQRKLIEVMRQAVESVEQRCVSWRSDLFDYVAQIVVLEREHERKATQIQRCVIVR